MMDRYKIVKAAPFANYFSKYTVVILFFLILFYFVISIIVLFGQKTRRPGEEQGSSKWESPQGYPNCCLTGVKASQIL